MYITEDLICIMHAQLLCLNRHDISPRFLRSMTFGLERERSSYSILLSMAIEAACEILALNTIPKANFFCFEVYLALLKISCPT